MFPQMVSSNFLVDRHFEVVQDSFTVFVKIILIFFPLKGNFEPNFHSTEKLSSRDLLFKKRFKTPIEFKWECGQSPKVSHCEMTL